MNRSNLLQVCIWKSIGPVTVWWKKRVLSGPIDRSARLPPLMSTGAWFWRHIAVGRWGHPPPSLFLCRHDHYYYSITHRTTASRALFSPSFFNGGGPTPRLILSIQQLQETISSSAETRHILHCCCVLSLCYGSGPPLNMYRKSALCMADGALFNNPQMSRWCCCSIGIKQTRGTPKSPAAGLPRINKEETRGQDKRGPHRRQQSDYITVTLVNLLLLLRRDRFYSFHVYWCYTSNIYSADKSQQVIKNRWIYRKKV